MNMFNVAMTGLQVNQVQLGVAAKNIAKNIAIEIVESREAAQGMSTQGQVTGAVGSKIQSMSSGVPAHAAFSNTVDPNALIHHQVEALLISAKMVASAHGVQSARQIESYLSDLCSNQK